MPTGEILFSRGGKADDSTADEWDDTELLREYDRAVRPVKALLAERMGITVEDITSATESCSSSKSALKDKAATNHRKNRKHKKRKNNKGKQLVEWTVGDHCQALYSVDGKMYEATIISLDHDSGICCVQFVGYGNEEELLINSLKQSMGSAVRRNQRLAAKSDEITEDETENPIHSSFSPYQHHQGPSKKQAHSNEKSKGPSMSFIPGPPPPHFPASFGMGATSMPRFPQGLFEDMVPPPPPPHVLSSLPVDESDALSAMLMSWYMSGFHTGYFQGLKKTRDLASFQMNSHQN